MNTTHRKIIIVAAGIMALVVVGIMVFMLLNHLDPSGRKSDQQDTPSPTLSQASAAKQSGEEAYEKGDYEAAKSHYSRALELYKAFPDQIDQVADIEVQLSLIEHDIINQREVVEVPGPAATD